MKNLNEAILNALGVFRNDNTPENEYKPQVRVQSSVDEGKHLSNIERQIHVHNEIKKLSCTQ